MQDVASSNCPRCGQPVLHIEVHCPHCGNSLAATGAQKLIGQVILDQYEITEVLGQGGMSVVYRGKHKLTGQEVALKILPPELAAHNQVKSRFLEEARSLAQLDHPNIVHLYNFGQDNGCFVLAMQFVEGRTWERIILRERDRDWRRSAAIAVDVLSALEYAHGRSVVHRDMKPSNVLVRQSDGSACVMDFGIAKSNSSSRLTATGQTMGTVRYMSPEQVRGLSVDFRTDLYSVAATLYEAVVGETPFEGETHFEIMTRHLNDVPLPPRSRGAVMPAALEEVILQGLAKKPAERPQSAAEMREQLVACLSGRKRPRPRDSRHRPVPGARLRVRAGPRLWLTLGSAVALGAAAVGFAVNADLRKPPGGNADDNRELTAGVRETNPPDVVSEPQPSTAKKPGAAGENPSAASPVWVEPKIPAGLELHSTSFAADRLRVYAGDLTGAPRLRDAYRSALRHFLKFLAGHGVRSNIEPVPLNLVLVSRASLCKEDWVYEESRLIAIGCEQGHWYRSDNRTLYLAADRTSEKELQESLGDAVAFHVCLHSPVPGCDEAAKVYVPE
jgi:serine/threonine protein kinase